MTDKSPSLTSRLFVGATWMVGMRMTMRVLSLVSTVILARLLAPEDFGLVALAYLVVQAVSVLGEFNFEAALIRDQNTTREHYDTAWTLNVIKGLAISAIMLACAAPVASFYDDARLAPVVSVIALGFAAEGFANIGVVDFRKELQFHRDFVFLVLRRLTAFVVTVSLAFAWRDYWALAVGAICGQFMTVASSYVMHPFRPRTSVARWRELFAFSKWLLAQSVVAFVNQNIDRIMIGKLMGLHELGVYTLANRIARLPSTEMVRPMQRALFPGFSKLGPEPTALRHAFVRVFSLCMVASLPAALAMTVAADSFVPVVLGPNWSEVIPVLQILAFVGVLQTQQIGFGSVLLTLNKPHWPAILTFVALFYRIPLIIGGLVQYGVLGAASGLLASVFIGFALRQYVLWREVGLNPLVTAAAIWRTALAGGALVGAGRLAAAPFGDTALHPFPILELAAVLAACAAAYVGVHLGLWRLAGRPEGPERELLRFARPKLERLRVRLARRARRHTSEPRD